MSAADRTHQVPTGFCDRQGERLPCPKAEGFQQGHSDSKFHQETSGDSGLRPPLQGYEHTRAALGRLSGYQLFPEALHTPRCWDMDTRPAGQVLKQPKISPYTHTPGDTVGSGAATTSLVTVRNRVLQCILDCTQLHGQSCPAQNSAPSSTLRSH